MPRYFKSSDGPDSWDKPEGNRFVRALLQRSWFLVIPLIGIWWFHTQSVVPKVHAIEEQIKAERLTTEQTRTKILSEARSLGVETSRLRAEADTFSVRAGQIAALLDSVRVLQQGHLDETRRLEAQSDSLRALLGETEGRAIQYSESLSGLQTKVDSIRVLIEAHQAEAQRLEDEIATERDLADRLARPEVYRKNTALVTGEGDYPNRDALPKR